MKAKKTAVIIAAMGMVSLLATGCKDSALTDEEIVVPKKEQGEQEVENPEGQGEESKDSEASGMNESGIAAQVQAPENYTWEGGNDIVSVKVNAPVVIPQAEGFKTYKVTARVFTQEDYDKVSQALLKGAALWERDEEKMAESNGYTREEIERRIARMKEQKASGGMAIDQTEDGTIVETDYDQEISKWEAMAEAAPEEVITKEVPALVSYRETTEDGEENGDGWSRENWLNGYATVDGQTYFISLDNNLRDDWRWIEFAVRNESSNSNYMPAGEEGLSGGNGLSGEEIRQKAEKLVADMGFDDFKVAGEEEFQGYTWDNEDHNMEEMSMPSYGVYFTRTLDGIPLTYTCNEGSTLDSKDSTPWPYEKLNVIYDENGVAEFSWANPYNVEKISDEFVFLLPFSEIQSIFEEMILKKYGDYFGGQDMKVGFEISEVRLGYMRVMEKGNTAEGAMVPVWDFFGKETVYFNNMEDSFTEGGTYESWLTVNAMDGTVIDRGLGY